MPKKMYVIQADDGMFFCGLKYWDKQLRKAKIYHSLLYANDVVKAYEECNCKILEVSLAIVPEIKTNADRIRAMTDEELAELLSGMCRIASDCDKCPMNEICPGGYVEFHEWNRWMKQPAEVYHER